MRILGLPPDIGKPGEPIKEIGQREPIGPCGQYRIKYPFEGLNQIDGIHAEYGGYPMEFVWEFARDFDIVVIQRQTMPHFLAFVDHVQTFLGKKVVLDIDDAVLDLDSDNPAYVWWGEDPDLVWEMFCKLRDRGQVSERMSRVTPEQVQAIVTENRSGFEWILKRADAVTVTTGFLKTEYAPYNENVSVLPNYIKAADWTSLIPKRHPDAGDRLVIGWSGGDSHIPDLESVKTALTRVLRRFENVVLVMVGFLGGRTLFPGDVQGKILTQPWTPIDEYRAWLGGFDIGIAPSQRIKTNHGKSGIRIYELALARSDGMPVVASPWPYRDDVHKGMGAVAPNSQKFEKALIRYIEDAELRKRRGSALRAHVLAEHTVDKNAWRWAEVYGNLIQ